MEDTIITSHPSNGRHVAGATSHTRGVGKAMGSVMPLLLTAVAHFVVIRCAWCMYQERY